MSADKVCPLCGAARKPEGGGYLCDMECKPLAPSTSIPAPEMCERCGETKSSGPHRSYELDGEKYHPFIEPDISEINKAPEQGGPDPLADLVVGTIICPGVPEHEHKIYKSELFPEYQALAAQAAEVTALKAELYEVRTLKDLVIRDLKTEVEWYRKALEKMVQLSVKNDFQDFSDYELAMNAICSSALSSVPPPQEEKNATS